MMKHLRRDAGHTLIETLVTLGILGVMVASGLPKWDPRRQDINTARQMVLGDYRYARARAITTGVHFSVKITNSQQYQVQRHVQNADGSWSVAGVVRTVNLPSNLVIGSFPDTLEFNTRGLMITLPPSGPASQLYVNLVDQAGTAKAHQFSVWPSGQINEEF